MVHQIQDQIVWTSTPRLAAFGSNGLYRYPDFSPWKSLLLPPVVGGGVVAVLRAMAGGFTADPPAVAVAKTTPPALASKGSLAASNVTTTSASSTATSSHISAATSSTTAQVSSDEATQAIPVATGSVLAPVPAVPARFPRPTAAPDSTTVAITDTPIHSLSSLLRWDGMQLSVRPYIKLVASAITLGSGASMGPEGPSVELGKATAQRITCVAREQRTNVATDLLAAGAGAGVAAGFGAPMSGVIFAVETVLLAPTRSSAPPTASSPDAAEDSGVLVATVLVACVVASVVSQAGLGLEPAFHVPAEAPLSVQELPLCVLLGLLCGTASAVFGAALDNSERSFLRLREWGVPPWLMPAAGGLACGSLAILFPEVTYQVCLAIASARASSNPLFVSHRLLAAAVCTIHIGIQHASYDPRLVTQCNHSTCCDESGIQSMYHNSHVHCGVHGNRGTVFEHQNTSHVDTRTTPSSPADPTSIRESTWPPLHRRNVTIWLHTPDDKTPHGELTTVLRPGFDARSRCGEWQT
eukprot:jgi/Ulvmu1/4513/UM002_0239.1